MSKHVIETVLFKLEEGVSKEDFIKHAETMRPFVEGQKGFVHRRLSCTEDGTWIEHIEWESMEDAKSAAANIGSSELTKDFGKAINGPSVQMMHSELEVSLN